MENSPYCKWTAVLMVALLMVAFLMVAFPIISRSDRYLVVVVVLTDSSHGTAWNRVAKAKGDDLEVMLVILSRLMRMAMCLIRYPRLCYTALLFAEIARLTAGDRASTLIGSFLPSDSNYTVVRFL